MSSIGTSVNRAVISRRLRMFAGESNATGIVLPLFEFGQLFNGHDLWRRGHRIDNSFPTDVPSTRATVQLPSGVLWDQLAKRNVGFS